MGTKVALLTTFLDAKPQYGVVPVVWNQLRMLTKFHDELPIGFFMVEGYDKHEDYASLPEGVRLEPYVPFLHLYDYGAGTSKQIHDVPAEGIPPAELAGLREGQHRFLSDGKTNITNYDRQVARVEYMLEDELVRYDTIITHDIMFQTWFLVHNQAVRNIARRNPELRWVHWCHSGPTRWDEKAIKGIHMRRFTGMKDSVWVSPNESMAAGFAKMYDISRKQVKVCYHVVDPFKVFKITHDWSRQLIEKHSLFDCDILDVWATRVDHPDAKGMYLALNIMAKLNKLCDAKILFLNSWSDAPSAKRNIGQLRSFAERKQLPSENLIFSSEMGSEWEKGVEPEVVSDMLSIANLFIFPSLSETFSFSLAEAALHKNMLVLNENLAVMKELAGDRADYLAAPAEWGGVRTDVTYDSGVDGYCMGRAEELWAQLQEYKPLMQARHVLRTFRDEWVWENQLRPIIEGEW